MNIPNARVAKLYQHLHDDEFSKVIDQFTASVEDGSSHFTLDVLHIDQDQRMDILECLQVLGYNVSLDTDSAEMDVEIES